MSFPKQFYVFLTAIAFQSVTAQVFRFAASWLAMEETDSAVVFAAVFSVASLVDTYFKPILSPIADYFDRLAVLRNSVILSFVVMTLLFGQIYYFGFSIISLSLALVFLSFFSALAGPASTGLVVNLVKPDQISHAVSMTSTLSSSMYFFGPMIGAFLLWGGGTHLALLLAPIFCLVAIGLMFYLQSFEYSSKCMSERSWSAYFSSWHYRIYDGIKAAFLTETEKRMALIMTITNAGLYPFFFITLPLWVAGDLHATPMLMGTIEASFCVGVIIGSVKGVAFFNKLLGRFWTLAGGNTLLGLGLFLSGFSTIDWLIVCLMFFSGFGLSCFNINAATVRASATPDHFRGRMGAGIAFLSSCLNPFAAQLFGFSIEWLSASGAVILSGTLILLATILLFRCASLRYVYGLDGDALVGIYEALYPKAFVETSKEQVVNERNSIEFKCKGS